MKRLFLTFAWTAGAYLGSSVMLGFLFGISFFFMAMFHFDPSTHHGLIDGISETLPILVAVTFLVLAIRQRLPGMRS